MTDDQLHLLLEARVMYMDATFRVVPSVFHQIFTVFVPYSAHLFPVFFALMTRKTTQLYEAVLSKLHTLQPDFRPTHVMADFEEAPATAVRQVFGNDVIVSGCWFHYAQALVKRLRKIGLTDSYSNNQETQTIFRSLLALPLLPTCPFPSTTARCVSWRPRIHTFHWYLAATAVLWLSLIHI